VRCAYLTNGAVLSGFTLTAGATQTSGDTTKQQSGGGVWCESVSATVSNCTLIGNSAAVFGGACRSGTINRCVLTANYAGVVGGAAYSSALTSCVIVQNSASIGGGAGYGALVNCTLTGNSARNSGGGISSASLTNSVIYFNTAPDSPNYSGGTMHYCCTTPAPSSGIGNLAVDPQLATIWRPSAVSACRGAGNAAYASGVDIDGEHWADPPSIGCDEYWSGSVTGELSVAMLESYTNFAVGFSVNFQASIGAHPSSSSWDFGDGVVVSNQPYTSHSWTSAGDYEVVLRAYNESYPAGVTATSMVHVVGTDYHVSLDSLSPVPPYDSWATAATNIQDAVDAAVPGSLVLVSNGIYEVGARAVYGMSNRVAISSLVTVRSLNGPTLTTIRGYQVPGTTNGDAAVRCAYVTNGAALSGFTLTAGATQSSGDIYHQQSGGAVWCESIGATVSNCVVGGNSAQQFGGGSCYGTMVNCTFTGNSTTNGGGATYFGALYHCTLTNNSALRGGGSYYSYLVDCLLTSNSASSGGAAYTASLSNCVLTGNAAYNGGGAYSGSLQYCLLTGNSAAIGGGGSYLGTLNSCTINSNSAGQGGGGYYSTNNNCAIARNTAWMGGATYYSTLRSCTVTGNTATNSAGGVYYGALTNCILYFNTAPTSNNYYFAKISYSCTTPLPTLLSVSNISADPQLSSFSHLSAASPCRGAGNATYVSGVDIDGEPWGNPPSMGCDESWSGSVTGSLSVAIDAAYTNFSVGFSANFRPVIGGRLTGSSWDFGDGTTASNAPYASHIWTAVGDYPVVLRAYNETYPAGVTATIMVHVIGTRFYYVAKDNPLPVPPYSSWTTAAANIQDAVDAVDDPFAPTAIVAVSNGIYEVGARAIYGMSNRLAITKPLLVQSVEGPGSTIIRGYQMPGTINGASAVRCVYLTNGAVLSGFTLTNGATQNAGNTAQQESGGGVWCESSTSTVSNCVLVGNSSVYEGGGVYGGTLFSCTLSGNSSGAGGGSYASVIINCLLMGNSASAGGGSSSASLRNCTMVGNSALNNGGGSYSGTLRNCIVYYNDAARGANYYTSTLLTNCCTLPQPTNGAGNLTNPPLFIDRVIGNYRLQPGSPCINAGNNTYAATTADLDGRPRVVGGTVDMGAYEFQPGVSGLFIGWLQQYGLPTDGSADFLDNDADGMNNLQEWFAGTSPTNTLSALRMETIAPGRSGTTVSWQSVDTRHYYIQRATKLTAPADFSAIQSNVVGQLGTTTFTDTTATNGGPIFYRVGIQ